MAFFNNNRAPTDIEQARKALDILRKYASTKRRIRMQKRIDFFYDKQEKYLDDLITDTFTYPDRLKLQKECYNITALLVDETAITYNEAPLRELQDATEQDDAIFSKIALDSGLDQVMQQVNRFTKLCNTVAVRPVWRNNTLQYDILTPNMFDVFQNILDPTEAVAFMWANVLDTRNEIPLFNDTTLGKHDKMNNMQSVFYYMDAKSFIAFTVTAAQGHLVPTILFNEGNSANENPYKELLFVTAREDVPVDQYFLEGGDGLVSTNELINIKLTELNYLTKMQSFSVPVRKGADDKTGSLILDPSVTVDLPMDDDISRNADFKFVSPDAKITDIENSIDNKIKKLALQRHLSPERFTLSAQKSSAEALQLRAWEQAKILKRDKPFYASFEQKLFEKTRIVWNFHNPTNPISDTASLYIDFKEIEVPMTVAERDNHNIVLNANGLLSKKKWLMSENPDIKDEGHAKDILEDIAQEKKADMGISIQDKKEELFTEEIDRSEDG